MLNKSHNNRIKIVSEFLVLFLFWCGLLVKGQTTLSPGDVAVIGFKTNTNTDSGNDGIKLVTLVDLECNTSFTITDNNWNAATPGWACNNDEFGIGITTTSFIQAGSVFYIDVSAAGIAIGCSNGSVTRTDLGNPWGTDYGLSSGGDNIYVLQGTRTSPSFIFAVKNNNSFSNNSCSNKDQAGLPASLTLGTSAVATGSSADQRHYNCTVFSGTKASILSAIGNSANWTTSGNQAWNTASCQFTVTGSTISANGILAVSGAGCGCLSGCNLSYSGGVDCGSGVSGNCSAGYQSMSKNIVVPSGCTYNVVAEMRNRGNGCSSSGADGSCQTCDALKVDILSGSKSFQQGGSNASLIDSYSAAGPATIVVSGSANRADEIITYAINVSPCNCLSVILPIELTEFSANLLEDKSVGINWTTAQQKNNEYFVVERSPNTEDWQTIYVMAGAGNNSGQQSYSVFDHSPLTGISYYRLKQVDYSREFTYSKVVSVNSGASASKKTIKRVNIYGQTIDANSTGLIIEIYETGETKKVFR